ncbi:MAG: T9SS type A sorting domain-containing protein [Bacteroidetes bacterium]|nr:T9SS type A sorting domain-containing protein [Bacteroidota bacterium]
MVSKISTYFLVFLFCILTSFAQNSFLPYQITNSGFNSSVVAIGDLNNDGLNDVALGHDFFALSPNKENIFVFYQNSSGGLNTPILYPYPLQYPGVSTISIGDLNNDGLNDLLIGYGDSIGIFFQNNLGALNPISSFFSGMDVDGVEIGDLNNDGLDDIAVAHWLAQNIRIFYQGTLGFTSMTYPKVQGGRDDIDIGDVNNDGLNDVVFMSGGSFTMLQVYTQNQLGILNNPVNYLQNAPHALGGIAIGDLNNDGRNDVAVSSCANQSYAAIFLLLQDSITGNLQLLDTLPATDQPRAVEIADLNCDGTNEIIVGNWNWSKISLYQQTIPNQFSFYTVLNAFGFSNINAFALSIGDINNDGRKDIAVADDYYGLGILRNNTPPLPTFPVTYDTLIKADTIYHSNLINNSYFFLRTLLNSDTTCHVVQLDSFKVKQTFSLDSIRVDSDFVRSIMICSLYRDTTVSSHLNFNSALISSDTLLIYTHLDTLYNPFVITDTVITKTKYFTDTNTLQYFYPISKTIESSSGCSVVENDIFLVTKLITLDSLQLDSTFLRSSVTCSFTRSDTVIKRIKVLDSKLISIDTVLFSSSRDTLLSSSVEEFNFCHLLNLYPLPTVDFITIEISDPCFNYYSDKLMLLELYDVNARLIFSNTINTKQMPIKIDMSRYANGLYCLRTTVEKNFCIKKLIKEK